MWFTNLCLLAPVSLIKAMPVIDTGVGSHVIGPEAQIRDFAIFTDNSLDNLPEPFTICSSIATKSFIGGLSPFQLLHEDGKPWISVNFEATDKSATFHHITITVSKKQFLSSLNLPKLHFAHWQYPINVTFTITSRSISLRSFLVKVTSLCSPCYGIGCMYVSQSIATKALFQLWSMVSGLKKRHFLNPIPAVRPTSAITWFFKRDTYQGLSGGRSGAKSPT